MKDTLLHEPLLRACELFPDRIAVDCVERNLTFDQLKRQAKELAARIQGLLPYGKEISIPVVITGRKNANSMVAALAALLSGGIYTPIDPFDPPRLFRYKISLLESYILISTGITDLLCETLRVSEISPSIFIDLAGDMPADIIEKHYKPLQLSPTPQMYHTNGSKIAYILFTSGSTGLPRAACVSHSTALAANQAIARDFAFVPDDRCLGQVSLSFDISLWDWFAAAPSGAAWVPLPLEIDDRPDAIVSFIAEKKITSISTVPAFFRFLYGQIANPTEKLYSVNRVLLTGEHLSDSTAKQIFSWMPPNVKLFDLFGATEMPHVLYRSVIPGQLPSEHGFNHIASCVEIELIAHSDENTQTFELVVKGPAIFSGYLSQCTRLKDVKQILQSYSSGDLFQIGEFGDLIPVGRVDRQCKINGFRFDLDSIEITVESDPMVIECAVLLHEKKDILVLYIVPTEGYSLDAITSSVRTTCLDNLPYYAQPNQLKIIPQMPRTLSGKKDRALLAL